MNILFKQYTLLLFMVFSVSSSFVFGQNFTADYYRIVSASGAVIDVLNDGTNNQLHLVQAANLSGQFWKITSNNNGFYRLHTAWLGAEKALDVVNDANDDKICLAKKENVTGQFWKLQKQSSGKYYLSTSWLGESKVLTAVKLNNAWQIRLQTKKTGDVNQLWELKPTSNQIKEEEPISSKKDSLLTYWVREFKVIVPSRLKETTRLTAVLDTLNKQIDKIQKVVPASAFAFFKKIPIWIEYKKLNEGAVWYHSDKSWLVENGYTPEMEKSVEIKNIEHFNLWQVHDQPFILLHELSHAFHDFLPEDKKQLILKGYKDAVASKKYESVPYINGGNLKHYALTNENEFFAEMSEAYFGTNDYFPFNRQDLKRYDPATFSLMQKIWGVN